MIKCYSELITLKTYEERFEYLRTCSAIGDPTLGPLRYLCQRLYHSYDWNIFRRNMFIRDGGNDLAMDGYPIEAFVDKSKYGGRAREPSFTIHHIVPVTEKELLEWSPRLFDPENAITCFNSTHKAIHFGDINSIPSGFSERSMYDTVPWRKR